MILKKKIWKQIIAVIMACALITGTSGSNTALAAGNKKNITATNLPVKVSGKTTKESSIAGNIKPEERTPELDRILNECEEIQTDGISKEIRKGQMMSVESISGNYYTKAAITENGDLYCWGYNRYGQVGNGTTENQLTPVKVLSGVKSVTYSYTYSYTYSDSFSDFSYAYSSVSAITENGDLYCWGYNGYGEAGNGTTENQLTPVKVLSGVKSVTYSYTYSYTYSDSFSDFSYAYSSVSAITENGDLYCWGYNGYGEAGNGTTENQLTPVKVLSGVKSVTYSYTSSYTSYFSVSAITENGDLYCWGYNGNGEAGNGTTENQLTPVKVLSGVKSVTYSYPASFSVSAITENGDLYCWGNNEYGQVGNGTTNKQLTPVKVLSGVKSVTHSYHSSFSVSAITENGDLYCWGDNGNGEVGNGTTENQLTPVKVLSGVKSVTYSSSSRVYYSVLAITENGDLYCWGYNGYGEAGNGTTENQLTPVKVLSGVKSVTSSYYSSYPYSSVSAITENGDLYCWGYNGNGEAGNGTIENQLTPVKVLSGVKSVTYSSYSSVSAITENGDLYCWGYNGNGEAGNGTTENQLTPVKVLSGVKSVTYSSSSSYYSSYPYSSVSAITENGDLYCWGYNGYGEAGNGTTNKQLTPVKVLSGVKSVTYSYFGSFSRFASSSVSAITENGDLYCWGYNGNGQIGNGTTKNQLIPVKVLPIDLPEDKPEISNLNMGEITVKVSDYYKFQEAEGAKVEIEGIGEAYTGADGKAHIPNSLNVPSEMKRITVSKEGYRDYILYTTIVHPNLVDIFFPNEFYISIKAKETIDDVNPYISSFVYYNSYDNAKARSCVGKIFEQSDKVTFRACGVWNSKTPSHYCLYQEGGNSFESEDGIFKLQIGKSFYGKRKIYIKMVAEDGTESEPELIYIRVPDSLITDNDSKPDNTVPILNESAESPLQTDVPFLHNDKLSFDIGKIKTTIKRDGSKIRIMLGTEISKNIFDDECWSDWKKFCESPPTDLSLSQWANVLNSDNLDTSWTSNAKIKATGYGWLENDLSHDSTTPLTGGIQVVIDLSTTFKQQYAIGVIPVYMEESLGVSGKLEGKVTFDINENKFGGSNSIEVTPSLSVGGGVGVIYVATVGAKGSASMPMKFNIPKGLTKADLVGSLSLEASVLGFKYSKEMIKATYPLFPSDTTKTRTRKIKLFGQDKNVTDNESFSNSLYDMDSYSLPDELITEPVWYGEKSLENNFRKASKTSSELAEILLQTGTSPLSEPVLVQEGDITMAVFLTEDSGRSVIHRSKLVYTVYNKDNGTWSEPATVCEDSTGDFNPYLSAANGKIAVSWLDYDSNITDSSSMKEALQSSKICYAVWNTDTKNFEKSSEVISSSEDVSYNGAHPYIDNDGNVTHVGIKNSSTDIFGISGDNILFMTGTCKNNKIDKEFTLSQGIPVSYDVAEKEGIITAAVCIDTDKDMTTLNDREIYIFSSDGTMKRLTENDTYDSVPQYAKYNGNDALYWYTEEGYKIFNTSGNTVDVLEEENMNISENFTVVNGENNETAVVWSCVDENSVYQLVASILDKESGNWSRQVVLSGSKEDIFRPSGYFNKDGDMEFIYRKGNTAEPGSLYTLQVKQTPDLQLVNAYIEDGTEVPGKTTKVFAGVRNLGTGKVTKYSISVNGQITEGTTEILPGESKLLEAEYKVPDDIQYGKIPVEVTAEGDVDTTNNTFQLATGYADVSVIATEDEFDNGRMVHVVVENCEAISTDAVLEVHKDAKDGELLSSCGLGTLKQGDIVTADFTYKKFPTGYDVDADALYYVITSSVPEKYESNNYDYSVFVENMDDDQEGGNVTEPTEAPSASPSVTPPTETPSASPSVTPIVTPSPLPSNTPTSKPSGGSSGGGTTSGGGGFIGGTPVSSPSPSPGPSTTPVTTSIPDQTQTPVATPVATPKSSQTPEATLIPSASPVTGENNNTSSSVKLKKGSKITDKKTKAVYKIISTWKNKTAEYAKSTKKNTTDIVIPALVKLKGKTFKVVSVGKGAFSNNKKLKSVKIGKNVKSIAKEAFSGCKKLKKVKMGKNLNSIGAKAFSNCTSLTIINIPSKVNKIGKKAFYQCKNLKYILVKTKKLKPGNIGSNAFSKGYSNPRVKSDKSVWKQYQNTFISKGLSNKALFIINPARLVV